MLLQPHWNFLLHVKTPLILSTSPSALAFCFDMTFQVFVNVNLTRAFCLAQFPKRTRALSFLAIGRTLHNGRQNMYHVLHAASARKSCSESNKVRNSKHERVVEAHESTRQRLKQTLPKDHEHHIAERRLNSLSHCNLVHKFVPVSSDENPGCRSSGV